MYMDPIQFHLPAPSPPSFFCLLSVANSNYPTPVSRAISSCACVRVCVCLCRRSSPTETDIDDIDDNDDGDDFPRCSTLHISLTHWLLGTCRRRTYTNHSARSLSLPLSATRVLNPHTSGGFFEAASLPDPARDTTTRPNRPPWITSELIMAISRSRGCTPRPWRTNRLPSSGPTYTTACPSCRPTYT